MPQFQVPQFIETESKIVGPLTLKQFLYIAVAGLTSFFLFFILKTFIWVLVTILLGLIAVALAFVKYNGRPLTTVIVSALSYYWNPRMYLWQRENVKTANPEIKVSRISQPAAGPTSKLKDLWLNLITKKPPVNKQ